ncbi:MAG: hypothetical protein V4592_15685 [Bacteroidota bacterium]
MKIGISIFLFILILSFTAFSQINTDRIAHIRSVFQNINTDKTFKKVVLDNDKLSKIDPDYHYTDGGQELTGYFKSNQLTKVTYSVGLSFGIKTFDFYFEEQKVIFIYECQQSFVPNEKTNALDYTKLKTTFEGRYYIDQNKVIHKVEKGNLMGEKAEAINLQKSDMPKFSRMLLSQKIK